MGGGTTPTTNTPHPHPPDAIKLSEKVDTINS